jgi:hypothetical protein
MWPGLCVLACFPKALTVSLASNGNVKFYKEALSPPAAERGGVIKISDGDGSVSL